ncbi:small G protein signaling modulator 1-like [Paramacrobiotus metropolitanus]|uniref:small G protein signaling modulator 1-like n=1 Tax=Paramacrobiotus metropolitanus TaxID=2943436 RepID=UPI002445D5CA|nr:small G protein signaling modulator 1-like [Paramacrobiotus metropolitanus]XP_055339769.1 small G protein signaling modulator 1-like [Paramacrobiotus metropolitanus]XP_055339770.1 small G protein signaling modulator 1-like [Paramacrobiotus metropolitanus]
MDTDNSSEGDNDKIKDRLMKHLKKEVKQIMEEAVMRKYISEDSSSITSLCACVEACLTHGLKRRTLGLFKTASSTAALLQKISKSCPEADAVRKIQYNFEPVVSMTSFGSRKALFDKRNSKSLPPLKKLPGPTVTHKYLWIRIALVEKVLDKIVDYLVKSADKYYSANSLIADPTDGPIIASLLVGPCALDFSRMKTPDHLWTDPSADELVLRHRIHGSAVQYQVSNGSLSSPKRFGLSFKRNASHSSSSCEEAVPRSAAKDYVESLHQNSKSTLLYGKNNVMMRPRDTSQPMQGYLSLHQSGESLLAIKWTPNQLMNTPADESFDMVVERSQYWDYAICISVPTIVYLHCHHQPDHSGSIVLVGQDGIQFPPLQFPPGGHLLAFLSCLETGLEPFGRLDPPLWFEPGIGKVFPHLKRKTAQSSEPESTSFDYVFRINCDLPNLSQSKLNLIMHTDLMPHPLRQVSSGIQSTLSNSDQFSSSNSAGSAASQAPDSPAKFFDFDHLDLADELGDSRSSMLRACDTMKQQLITRAFYGWLAHCRHLRTVRQHLSGLVAGEPVTVDDPADASSGLSKPVWEAHRSGDSVLSGDELCRLVYYGGVEPSIRREVWPCLLGHHAWHSSGDERDSLDAVMRVSYEHSMSEWMAVEAIVRQRDKESFAASVAKITHQTSVEIPLVGKDTTLSNDVFEDDVMSVSSTETPSEWTLSAQSAHDRKESLRSMPSISKDFVDDGTTNAADEPNGSTDVAGNNEVGEAAPQEAVNGLSSSVMITQSTVDHHNADSGMQRICSTGFLGDELKESECPSPASSIGGIYTEQLVDEFAMNLHRIDKDVARCDRTYYYFTHAKNLEKLRNIMSTYIWLNLKEGYVQGMCDVAAPLLVTFDDEVMAFTCFSELMKRMARNFPTGGGMDRNFANMRSLIQVLDPELYDLMRANGDYTHFYFCYRWFLLDFKRELVYDDVFMVWETIWAATRVASQEFVLFLALAMLECYRDIILDNGMDFTDIIKFFNEMAEHHDGKTILRISRDLVQRIQNLINTQ